MRRPEPPPHTQLPAWPLGCALTLLNLLMMIGLSMGLGIILANGPAPGWLAVGLPVAAALLVPAAELAIGSWLRRGRNPYAGQVLLWGVAITLLALSALTAILGALDRASGAG